MIQRNPILILVRVLLTTVLLWTAGAGRARPSSAKAPPTPLSRWPEGPVRYLLTGADDQEFRRLSDEPARALFIVRFWHRWDPTPGTLENETRREFWRRVIEVNRRFRDSVRPGWMTDRGRVFISLGPPDQEQVEEGRSLEGLTSSSGGGSKGGGSGGRPEGGSARQESEKGFQEDSPDRGLLRWIYRSLPGKHSEPETIFAFTRDSSGEWRLSQNPGVYSPVFPGVSVRASDRSFGGPAGPGGGTLGGVDPSLGTVLAAAERAEQAQMLSDLGRQMILSLDLAESTRLPGPGEAGATVVTAEEFLDRIPIVPRFAFFRASDGNTQVRLGASVPARAVYKDRTLPPDLTSFILLYARFAPASGGQATFFMSNEASPSAVTSKDFSNADAVLEAWGSRTLPPGSYEASVGLQDAATGVATSARQAIDIPDMTQSVPALSSLLPASRLDDSSGELVPTPRVSATFRRDEEFGVYFQVYNLAEREGRSSFDLTYRFYLRAGQEERPIGKPIARKELSDPTQGWSFPLQRWPPGSYRLEVTVEDRYSEGSQASASLSFSVL